VLLVPRSGGDFILGVPNLHGDAITVELFNETSGDGKVVVVRPGGSQGAFLHHVGKIGTAGIGVHKHFGAVEMNHNVGLGRTLIVGGQELVVDVGGMGCQLLVGQPLGWG
jgi:hypothetical protein